MCLGRQRGSELCFQAAEVDRVARVLTIAVGAIVEADQRQFDLAQQSFGAFPADSVKFPLDCRGGLIGLVALAGRISFVRSRNRVQFALGFRLQPQQLLAEIFRLQRIHELFAGRRRISVRQMHWHGYTGAGRQSFPPAQQGRHRR